MSNGCLSILLRRMGLQGRQTPHGFRVSGQTNCIEQLKIPRVVTEKQLAQCRWQQRQPGLRLGRISPGALQHAAALYFFLHEDRQVTPP
jgi:hypothetical protein